MVITSTKFQQNVGFYLSQVQAGKEVIIEKKKRGKGFFKLQYLENIIPKHRITKEEFEAHVRSLHLKPNKESGLEFQRRVRS